GPRAPRRGHHRASAVRGLPAPLRHARDPLFRRPAVLRLRGRLWRRPVLTGRPPSSERPLRGPPGPLHSHPQRPPRNPRAIRRLPPGAGRCHLQALRQGDRGPRADYRRGPGRGPLGGPEVSKSDMVTVTLTREQIETIQTGLHMWRHSRDTGDDWTDVEEIDRVLEEALGAEDTAG